MAKVLLTNMITMLLHAGWALMYVIIYDHVLQLASSLLTITRHIAMRLLLAGTQFFVLNLFNSSQQTYSTILDHSF